VIVGTRPEAIKMAPVIRELSRSKVLRPITVSTSQHREMVNQIFRTFGIRPDHELRVMRNSQTLWDLSARLAARLGRFLDETPVCAALVQGDTSSALFGGLCAFYHQLPVGHIEAGLRTGHRYAPFPEEMNRTLLSAIATWHFAPTQYAATRLKAEGVPRKKIYLTGNPVVDALRWIAPRCSPACVKKLIGQKRAPASLILVTCHRRESLGRPMKDVAAALASLAERNPDTTILFPLHPNPAVRKSIIPKLKSLPNIVLCGPLGYGDFLSCLKYAHIVISDSGGVQEEATALGKPVLVLREQTERSEGVEAGALKLVGTNPEKIVRETERLLRSPDARQKMSQASDVFGDGKSARRIVGILERWFQNPSNSYQPT
jgi:UDP-N-acetylglucosamine 2-epimerase (non-hydrolysing)